MSEEFLKKLYQPFEQESADVARNMVGTGPFYRVYIVQFMECTIEVESSFRKELLFP